MEHFAMLPTPLLVDNSTLRIFLGFCTSENVGRIGYVDVDPENPKNLIQVSKTPVLDIGSPGTFDDNGVVPISVIKKGRVVYLYYIGFQLGINVPYYMFCGLAVSHDNGNTFVRLSKSPVLDRTSEDLFARCGVNVIQDEGVWKAYYVGGVKDGWTEYNGKRLPLYTMKYIESKDGISWDNQTVKQCLEFNSDDEHGFGRPHVFKEGGLYKMYYSIRTYSRGYYIGYAESSDGVSWNRKDDLAGIGVSLEGWDSMNISYPYIYKYKDKMYMFYNGNGCGKTGFGYAEWSND